MRARYCFPSLNMEFTAHTLLHSRSNLKFSIISMQTPEAPRTKRSRVLGKRVREEPEIPDRFLDARGCVAVLQQHRDANIWYLVPEIIFLRDVAPIARQSGFRGSSLFSYLQQAPEVRDYSRDPPIYCSEDEEEEEKDTIITGSCEDYCMCRRRRSRREESTALDRLLRFTWKSYRHYPRRETGVCNAKFVITLLGGDLY